MRGRITEWKDDRGFGFIQPNSGGERVFFHISGVARGTRRPSIGDHVHYQVSDLPDGKLRAVGVAPAGTAALTNILASKRLALSLVAVVIFPVVWWLVVIGKVPHLLFPAIAGMSAVTFALYGLDKWAAKRGAQRTPENTLQCCALLGGWPGALLAQQVFRHKSSKRSFQVTFWLMVVLNCSGLVFLFSPQGSAVFRQLFAAP